MIAYTARHQGALAPGWLGWEHAGELSVSKRGPGGPMAATLHQTRMMLRHESCLKWESNCSSETSRLLELASMTLTLLACL